MDIEDGLNFLLEDFKNIFVDVFEEALVGSHSNAKHTKVSDFLKRLPKNERRQVFSVAADQIFNSFSVQIYLATYKKYFYKFDLCAMVKVARRRCFEFIHEYLEGTPEKCNFTPSFIVKAILEGQLVTTSKNTDSFENAFQIKCPLIYEKAGIKKTDEETVQYYCDKNGKNNCTLYGYRKPVEYESQDDVKFQRALNNKYNLDFICTQRMCKRNNVKVNVKKSSDNFTGRLKEIRLLHSMLFANRDDVMLRCAVISGLRGVGKTELVRKYLEIHEVEFDCNTIWIDCKSKVSFRNSFEQLFLFLNKDNAKFKNNIDEFEIRELAINSYKFLLNSRSLIVFDDVENAGDIYPVFPPCCVSYSNLFSVVIISSNHKIISRGNNSVKFLFLGCLSSDDAYIFAETLLKKNELNCSNPSVVKLVEAVNCLPSAIKKAVEIFVKKTETTDASLESFLEAFARESERKMKVLDQSLYDKHTEILGQIRNCANFGENTAKLFEIMAYLGERRLNVENLVRLTTEITGVYNAVDVLCRHSLFYKGYVNCVYKELTRCIVRKQNREKEHLEIILRKPKLFQISDSDNEEIIFLWRYVKEYPHLVNSYIYSPICLYSGLTPIHLLTGHIDILKSVLRNIENDFKVNMNEICDNFSRTPLDIAVINGHSTFVRTYFKNDVISIFHSELNAAISDSKYNAFDAYLSRLDPRIINSEYGGVSALHNTVACSNINITKILLNHHIEVNLVNASGMSPLHIACQNGHLGIVKLLINFKADTKRKDVEGWTPLFHAVSRGHDHLVEYFMSKNLVIGKQTDIYGRTVFHVAVQSGRLNIVEYFLKNRQLINLDINATALYGNSAIFTAAFNGHWDVFQLLLENNAVLTNASNQSTLIAKLELSVLHLTSAFNNLPLVRKLVEEHKIDANVGYGVSFTPAYIAEYFENSEICSYLSNMRAKVNINRHNILSTLRNILEEHEKRNDIERILCTDFLSIFDKRCSESEKRKKLQTLINLLLDIKRGLVREIISRRLHVSQKLAPKYNQS